MTPRRDTRVAMLLVLAIALAVYVPLAAPTVMFADSAEMQIVGLTGGIPHSSGYPGFVLVGRLFAHLPLADPAFRITFMSAFLGAASLALLVLLLRDLGISPVASVVAALLFGSTFTMWRVSLRAEVYTLSVFLDLLALWRSLVALRGGSLRDALLAGLLLGISLTVHLSFILPVAALGLALAWRVARTRPAPIPALIALLGAFLLGLTPYLYLVWADTRNFAYDYLRVVSYATNPSGVPDPHFDTPWKRVAWLVTGRNQYPPQRLVPAPLYAFHRIFRCGALLTLFELGPIAAFATVEGFFRRLSRDPGTALLLAGVGGLSLLFTAAFAAGPITHIFFLPLTLVCTIFAASAIDAFLGPRAGRAPTSARAVALATLTLAALALPPHLIRVRANAHPIGPWGLRVEEEDPTFSPPVIPSHRGFRTPREYGEQAMAAIPRDALVLGDWPEFANLIYFQAVEHLRPDLTLRPISRETLEARMRIWQRTHPVGARPFVFLSPPPDYAWRGGALDSLTLAMGRRIYVRRAPIPAER